MVLLVTGPDANKRRFELTSEPVSVGRAPENVLSYPNDLALSRKHLIIEPCGDGWQVRDCGSRNGTRLNHKALASAVVLQPGDRIGAGRLSIHVLPDEEMKPQYVTSLEKVLEKTLVSRNADDSSLGAKRAVAALIRAGQELAGHRPLERLFEVILDLALDAVEARRGALALESDGFVPVAVRGESFTISTAVRDKVVKDKSALLIEDAQEADLFRKQHSIARQQIRSILAVPLQTEERVIGILYVDNASVPKPFSKPDLELLTVLANVAAIRIEHARLAQVEQNERLMQSEIEQASEIQKDLLPDSPPHVSGYEFAGFNEPCRGVGGDYYDFLPYAAGSIALCIADVCGKGLPAALMMSSLQARVQMLAESSPPPALALQLLNRSLAARFPLGKFITCLYAVLNPVTHELQVANAGHNHLLVRSASGKVTVVETGGLVLGLLAAIDYDHSAFSVNPGDTLLFYSDGVTEAANPQGEYFGEARLIEWFSHAGGASLDAVLRELARSVRNWSENSTFADDFTVVCARRS